MLSRSSTPLRQHGLVLIVALIMLIAMTMGGIVLISAVYTSSLAAGNIAFQQSATFSGDAGIEAGITWLEQNSSGTTLHQNSYANGYSASREEPGANQNWHDFWALMVGAGQVKSLVAADASGNSVAYVIHRLCNSAGAPTSGVGCATPQASAASGAAGAGAGGGGRGSGVVEIRYDGQVYYRITARVTGPRSTVSYVQMVVAM
jgi:type IV pilus assembly protein PilX